MCSPSLAYQKRGTMSDTSQVAGTATKTNPFPDQSPVTDAGGEFPTAWHRESYIADLRREVAGCETVLSTQNKKHDRYAYAQQRLAAAKAELARLGARVEAVAAKVVDAPQAMESRIAEQPAQPTTGEE